MVKNLFLGVLALFTATTATAQSFPKPPDVPDYVEVIPTYQAGTTPNVIGDGTSTGGFAPQTGLTDIPTSSPTSWVSTGTYTLCETTYTGGTCVEAKFRSHLGVTHVLFDDPIRNYGKPGTSHCHVFFGNASVNAYSTYATLRNNAPRKSVAAGGGLNGTGYWMPCMIKVNPFGDGKNYIVKPSADKHITLYYANSPANSIHTHALVPGLRYVGGYDMDNGGNWLKGILEAANAQAGTAGRYRFCRSGSADSVDMTVKYSANRDCGSYFSWRCLANDGTGEIWSDTLKNADGSDPYGGKCTDGQDLWVQFLGPECWDGTNLWSPGGYKHLIPKVWDTKQSDWICPNGWYFVPALQLQIHYNHHGFSDYGNWKLACDDAAGTLPGGCFHTDWMMAWDNATILKWLDNCIGVGNRGNTTPHECNSSTISSTEMLIESQANPVTGVSPTKRNLYTNSDTSTAAGMWEIPSTQNGPATIHVHGN